MICNKAVAQEIEIAERLISMRSVSELESQVMSAEAQHAFREAHNAFNGGAYRAAIIYAWIAVTVDLIGKVRLMAETDAEADAKQFIDKLDDAIKRGDGSQQTKLESQLLGKAQDLELITPIEAERLGWLKKDRNHCAHPAFNEVGIHFTPSKEIAYAHLANAVDCCLTLPAMANKSLIQQYEKDIRSSTWPDEERLTAYIEKAYFCYARKSAKNNLIKLTIKQALRPTPDNDSAISKVEYAKRCRVTVAAMCSIDEEAFIDGFRKVFDSRKSLGSGSFELEELLRFVGVFGNLSMIRNYIDDEFILKVKNALDNASEESLIDSATFATGCSLGGDVDVAYMDAYERVTMISSTGEWMKDNERNNESFNNLKYIIMSSSSNKDYFVEKAIQLIGEAGSFRCAEERISLLKELVTVLDVGSMRRVSDVILGNSQCYMAFSVPELLEDLCLKTKGMPGMQDVWIDFANKLIVKSRSESLINEGYENLLKIAQK